MNLTGLSLSKYLLPWNYKIHVHGDIIHNISFLSFYFLENCGFVTFSFLIFFRVDILAVYQFYQSCQRISFCFHWILAIVLLLFNSLVLPFWGLICSFSILIVLNKDYWYKSCCYFLPFACILITKAQKRWFYHDSHEVTLVDNVRLFQPLASFHPCLLCSCLPIFPLYFLRNKVLA